MRRRAPPWFAIAPLLGVVACADVWGFKDLTASPDGGSDDATTTSDAPQGPGPEAAVGDDVEADSAGERDVSAGEAGDARSEEGGGDAGEGGGPSEAGPKDSGDDGAAAARCKLFCSGCCDANGKCVTGTSMTACGTGGEVCVVCPGAACTLGTACCGATSGQCGCTAVGLLCNKN